MISKFVTYVFKDMGVENSLKGRMGRRKRRRKEEKEGGERGGGGVKEGKKEQERERWGLKTCS